MRGLLFEYGLVCNASGVMVVSCSGLTSDSLDNRTTWYSSGGGGPDVHHRKKCQLKSAFNKQHMPLPLGDGTLKTSFLEHNHIDMLYGHQPLGSAHGWRDASGEQVDAQYFTFFRDAMTKYVSEVQFSLRSKNLNLQEIIRIIKKRVLTERQQGKYHNIYTTYLITPQQRSHGSSPSKPNKVSRYHWHCRTHVRFSGNTAVRDGHEGRNQTIV